MPWGVIFPGAGAVCPPGWAGPCARHPTPLYEAGLEGLLLGLVVWYLVTRRDGLRFPWAITGTFLAIYGAARFLVEFWRVPDPQFLARHPQGHVVSLEEFGLTMGQLLSLPMVLAGLALIALARARGRR
jgi:phosphatidylglycerol---prolipoprotein diacylglyceryl transferase